MVLSWRAFRTNKDLDLVCCQPQKKKPNAQYS